MCIYNPLSSTNDRRWRSWFAWGSPLASSKAHLRNPEQPHLLFGLNSVEGTSLGVHPSPLCHLNQHPRAFHLGSSIPAQPLCLPALKPTVQASWFLLSMPFPRACPPSGSPSRTRGSLCPLPFWPFLEGDELWLCTLPLASWPQLKLALWAETTWPPACPPVPLFAVEHGQGTPCTQSMPLELKVA